MKNYYYLSVAGLAFVAAFSMHLQLGQPLTPLSSISLEQVEALANSENQNSVRCSLPGCLDCPESSIKVRIIE